MKKLLVIIILSLLFSNNLLAQEIKGFFGINFGENADKYKIGDCKPCVSEKTPFNIYDVDPELKHDLFTIYYIFSTPKSNLITAIYAESEYKYYTMIVSTSDPTHKNACFSNAKNLLNVLYQKYIKENSDTYKISLMEKYDAIFLTPKNGDAAITITSECRKKKNDEPGMEFYKVQVSTSRSDLTKLEKKEYNEFLSGNTSTSGF